MKEFRIEDPQCRCSGRARQIESQASSDWLAFRAPLVTFVTCRRQVSSIYRMVNNRSRTLSDTIRENPKVNLSQIQSQVSQCTVSHFEVIRIDQVGPPGDEITHWEY